jgi:hypothetical protein
MKIPNNSALRVVTSVNALVVPMARGDTLVTRPTIQSERKDQYG